MLSAWPAFSECERYCLGNGRAGRPAKKRLESSNGGGDSDSDSDSESEDGGGSRDNDDGGGSRYSDDGGGSGSHGGDEDDDDYSSRDWSRRERLRGRRVVDSPVDGRPAAIVTSKVVMGGGVAPAQLRLAPA